MRKPRWVVGWRLKPEVVPAWSDHAVPMVGSASQLELCRALHHIPSSHHCKLPSAIVKGGLRREEFAEDKSSDSANL